MSQKIASPARKTAQSAFMAILTFEGRCPVSGERYRYLIDGAGWLIDGDEIFSGRNQEKVNRYYRQLPLKLHRACR